jgi:hypothetical protein
MKNQKLKNALKKLNAGNNNLANQKDMEFLDSKKADQIRGGFGAPLGTSSSSDSCGKVFSCGLYHVV